MLLVRTHVTNYRSVEDSGEFAIEPDVTCLVGKNESGKTADLQALYRLNPVDASAVFDEVIDFPSRLTRQRKQQAGDRIPAVTATFQLTDDEIAAIEEDLGAGALAGREFTVTNGYRYSDRTFGFSTTRPRSYIASAPSSTLPSTHTRRWRRPPRSPASSRPSKPSISRQHR